MLREDGVGAEGGRVSAMEESRYGEGKEAKAALLKG